MAPSVRLHRARALFGPALLVLATQAHGAGSPPDTAWTGAGLAVAAAANAQGTPAIALSSSGGIVLAWEDARAHPDTTRVLAQRLLADGTLAGGWPAGGVACATGFGNQASPQVIGDGAGGLFVVWEDTRSTVNPRLYAQHLTVAGVPATGWPAAGLRVCARNATQRSPRLVTDGAGGALVVWEDYRLAPSRIFAQHLLADGSFAPGWADSGRLVADAIGGQVAPAAVADGAGGVFMAWNDGRGGGGTSIDVYAQRLKGDGTLAAGWPGAGQAVCTAAGAQARPDLALDGTGGIVVVWSDPRDGVAAVYAQRLTGAGVLSAGWPVDGIAAAATAENQFEPVVTGDGAGRCYVVWVDARAGGGNPDLYAQYMNSDGSVLWDPGGVGLCTAAGPQLGPRVVADGAGGFLASWLDERVLGESRVFAQRFTSAGNAYAGWPAQGRGIAPANLAYEAPVPAASGDGGVYLAWSGAVEPAGPSAPDLFAGRIAGNGLVPVLASLVRAQAEPDRVRLRWWVPASSGPVAVERRRGEEAWRRQSGPAAAIDEIIDFEDTDVVPGGRYGYRLAGVDGIAGETWVDVPRNALALAVRAARPAGERAVVSVTLAAAAPATLELFDVTGRRRWALPLAGTGIRLDVGLDTRPLEPGVFLLRLSQGAGTATARLPVLR